MRVPSGPSRWDSVRTTYAAQGCGRARKAGLASALGFAKVVPSGRQSCSALLFGFNHRFAATALQGCTGSHIGTTPP
jgi:hypothetical protein